MRRNRWRTWLGVSALLVHALGCGSSFPEEKPGGRIRGLITYHGDRLQDIARPMVGAYAFTSVPTGADDGIIPNAFHLYPPEFGDHGLAYELKFLAAHEYWVIVQLIDLDRPPGDPLAAGGYPNLLQQERVAVTDEAPTEDIDVELYDMWD